MTPAISLDLSLWNSLLDELSARGEGWRESAAFLLAPKDSSPSLTVAVTSVAYLDDLDATCLTGGITFSADGQSKLSSLCRERGLKVVADVHTHPGTWVSQSHIDAASPMVAVPGHLAIIVPRYAQNRPWIEKSGVHLYRGDGEWTSAFGVRVHDLVELRESAHAPEDEAESVWHRVVARLRRLLREVRRRD